METAKKVAPLIKVKELAAKHGGHIMVDRYDGGNVTFELLTKDDVVLLEVMPDDGTIWNDDLGPHTLALKDGLNMADPKNEEVLNPYANVWNSVYTELEWWIHEYKLPTI